MKTTPSDPLPILLMALALLGATLGALRLSRPDFQGSVDAAATVAQSTTAILEERAA